VDEGEKKENNMKNPNKKPEIEIYQLTVPEQYYRGQPHTDSIEYVQGSLTDKISRTMIARIYKNNKVLYDAIMDYHKYMDTVDANNTPSWESEDYPEEGIRVILFS